MGIKEKKPRKPGSGGKRAGSGRKPRPKTVTISFRVKPDQVAALKEMAKKLKNPDAV